MSGLDLKGVQKLVKILRANGVQKFDGLGLQIVIGAETNRDPITPTVHQTKVAERTAEIITQDSLIKENIESVTEQLDLLMIEDPAEFERQLREGELEDGSQAENNRGSEQAL